MTPIFERATHTGDQNMIAERRGSSMSTCVPCNRVECPLSTHCGHCDNRETEPRDTAPFLFRLNGSPKADALLRRDVIFGIRPDPERLVPRVEVADRSQHPVPAGAVRVARDLSLDRIVALVAAPCLRISQEEALVAG